LDRLGLLCFRVQSATCLAKTALISLDQEEIRRDLGSLPRGPFEMRANMGVEARRHSAEQESQQQSPGKCGSQYGPWARHCEQ
jgi:hypothetical protein